MKNKIIKAVLDDDLNLEIMKDHNIFIKLSKFFFTLNEKKVPYPLIQPFADFLSMGCTIELTTGDNNMILDECDLMMPGVKSLVIEFLNEEVLSYLILKYPNKKKFLSVLYKNLFKGE